MKKMKYKTKLSPFILFYYILILVIIGIFLYNLSMNKQGFSIIVSILFLLLFVNRTTFLYVDDYGIKIIDFYFFIPVLREKINRSSIKKIKIQNLEKGLPEGSFFNDIFVSILFDILSGRYFTKAKNVIEFDLIGKDELHKYKVNAPLNSLNKVLQNFERETKIPVKFLRNK